MLSRRLFSSSYKQAIRLYNPYILLLKFSFSTNTAKINQKPKFILPPKRKEPPKEEKEERDDARSAKVEENESYAENLKPNEIESLAKVVSLPTARELNSQDFSRLLQDLTRMDLVHVESEHLYTIIKFLGGSIFRKLYLQRTFTVTKKVLAELKSRDVIKKILEDPVQVYLGKKENNPDDEFQRDFLLNKVHNIILSCSNLNYYDSEIFDSYKKFLQYDNGRLIKEGLEIKSVLALFWSYKRLNRDSEELSSTFVNVLKDSIPHFTEVNSLRLLWILSLYPQAAHAETIKKLVRDFLDKKQKKRPSYSYNAKNAFQFLQICYSLYPVLLKNTHYNIETGETSWNPLPYKATEKQLIEEGNPYMTNFKEVYDLYLKCQLLASQKFTNIKVCNQSMQTVYIENKVNDTSYFALKPQIVPNNSIFENNVIETLDLMPELKFFTKPRMGIYEVDVVVYPDIILEINGDNHFVQESDREFMLNYLIRLKHLKELGLKKVADLSYHEWARTDNNLNARKQLIKQCIQEAKLIT